MASITNAKLVVSHDHEKKLVHPIVTCDVNFTPLELCQMRACRESRHFKLKCQLWGEDGGFTGADDFLYTYSNVFYFPDATPSATEHCKFDVILGEGVLDEDWGEDEVYGLLRLVKLDSGSELKKKTNTVSHHF